MLAAPHRIQVRNKLWVCSRIGLTPSELIGRT